MNFHHYRAYVDNKNKVTRKMTITAKDFEDVKKTLETHCYDVEKVDELVFINRTGEVITTFNVRQFIRFGKVSK